MGTGTGGSCPYALATPLVPPMAILSLVVLEGWPWPRGHLMNDLAWPVLVLALDDKGPSALAGFFQGVGKLIGVARNPQDFLWDAFLSAKKS